MQGRILVRYIQMKNPFTEELVVVLWCVLCGCASGIWYDFFKAIRKTGVNSIISCFLFFSTIISKPLFLSCVIIVYSVLFVANDGVLRWYEFFFIAFGFLLYRWLLSELIVFIWRKLFDLFKGVLKVLFLPLKIMCKTAEKYKKTKLGRFIRRIFKKQL